MPTDSFAADLLCYGPERAAVGAPSLNESRRYCRRLARRHYENFTAATRLLPGSLRQDFCNVYAYCRWADDLADETGDPTRSLELLNWWECELYRCYEGRAVHPVFVALGETIRRFDIPQEPWIDLLVAFRQDQWQTRYETLDDLLGYCRHSANPVGRLVLYLGRSHDPARGELADAVCTGLQLANFWQDVAQDWDRGRVYLPGEHLLRFGCDESHFARREANDAFRRLMAFEVDEAEAWLRRGTPLIDLVSRELRLPVALFLGGGLAILDAIRRADYDVWARRPTVTKWEKLCLLARCWWRLKQGNPTIEARP